MCVWVGHLFTRNKGSYTMECALLLEMSNNRGCGGKDGRAGLCLFRISERYLLWGIQLCCIPVFLILTIEVHQYYERKKKFGLLLHYIFQSDDGWLEIYLFASAIIVCLPLVMFWLRLWRTFASVGFHQKDSFPGKNE